MDATTARSWLTTLLTATVIAAIVIEVATRMFPGQPFVHFVLIALGIIAAHLVLVRVPGATPAPARQGDWHDESTTAPPATEDRESGTVKWFNRSKGFGFIIRASGDEIFVHYRGIQGSGRRSLRDGEAVSFRVISRDRGLQADQVRPLRSDETR